MNHVTQMLGLAMRAGCVVSGEARVVDTIRSGKARLVFIAKDAGYNSQKKLSDKAHTYKIPVRHDLDRQTLGRAIGKEERVAVAVIEQGFAAQMIKMS